jgi:hypothetical protein
MHWPTVAGIIAFLGILWALWEPLAKILKSWWETIEAKERARKARAEADLAVREQSLQTLESRMHELDEQVRREKGSLVRIVDPQVYVDELKQPLELVKEVLRRKALESRVPMQDPSRWKSRW